MYVWLASNDMRRKHCMLLLELNSLHAVGYPSFTVFLSIKKLFYLSRFSAAYFCRWLTSTRSGLNAWVQWKLLNYRSWESGLSISSFHCAAWVSERSACELLNMTISFACKATQIQKLTFEVQMGKPLCFPNEEEKANFMLSDGLLPRQCKIQTH